jgi:AraC-like DNA-binding protein
MKPALQVKDKIETDKTVKIAPFRKDIRNTEPHRHNNYIEIIYLSKGKGFHVIDEQLYDVNPPVLFIIKRDQVHHWQLTGSPDGFVLIMKKAYADNSLDKELKNLLSRISTMTFVGINEKETIQDIFELLVKESQSMVAESPSIVEGLLRALLAKILQQAHPNQRQRRKPTNLYSDFRELLNQGQVIKNSVAYYARLLNTSPQNLNKACRQMADLSAASVLSEYIIGEAKRLLYYTDMTVSQVSLSLDFKDNSHFVKYFKRHAGYTPQSFRRLG